MKKIIKKLSYALSAVIVLLGLVFIVNLKPVKTKAASSTTGGITVNVSYSTDFEGNNTITEVGPGDTFYFRVTISIVNKINTLQMNWNFSDIYDKADYTVLIGNGSGEGDMEAIFNEFKAQGYSEDDAATYAEEYSNSNVNFNAQISPATSGTPTSGNKGSWGIAASKEGEGFNTKKLTKLLEKYVFLVKVKLHADCTSWAAPMTVFNAGTTGAEVDYDLEHSLGVQMASGQSSSTALTTATVQGSSESSARNITFASTMTATVPNASTSATLKLVADGGKATISNVKIDGTTATLSNGTLSVPSLVAGTPKAVTFTVTAQDTITTANYTINVTREARSVKTLDDITFANPAGTASGVVAPSISPAFSSNTFTGYTVSYADSVSSIDVTPTITPNQGIKSVTVNGTAYTGSAINVPVSGNTTTVNVVVTAEDGTTQPYEFTLTKKTSDLTLSIAINSGGQNIGSATVNENAGTATGQVAYTNSSISITVTPTKAGNTITIDGSVGQNSSTKTFGTGNVTYSVKITDSDTGAEKTYTVTITRLQANTDKDLTAVALKVGNTTYSVSNIANNVCDNLSDKIPYNTTTVTITPTITGKYYTVGSSNTQYQNNADATVVLEQTLDLSKDNFDVIIHVFDEGGQKKDYTLKVYRKPADNDSTIDTTNIQFKDDKNVVYTPQYDSVNKKWVIELPYTANDLLVKVNPTKSTSTMTMDGTNLPANYFYTINVGSSAQTSAIAATQHQLVVTAQNPAATTTYVIEVSRKAADSDNTASSIVVDNTTKSQTDIATQSGDTYSVGELSFDTTALAIKVTPNSTKATVKINGQSITGNNNLYTYNYTISSNTISIPVIITSEAGVPKTYTITGTRKVAATTAAVSFNVAGNYGGTVTESQSGNTYTYVFDKNDTYATLEIVPDANNAPDKIYYQEDAYNNNKLTYTGGTLQPLTIGDYQNGKTIYVAAVPEAGANYQTLYTLIFKAPDTRSGDASLANLYLEDASTSAAVAFTGTQTTYSSSVYTYDVEVPYNSNNLAVYPIPTDVNATVYRNNSGAAAVTNISVAQIPSGQTVSYTYIVKAENGTYGQTYTINVKRKAGVSSGKVDDIKVNGTSVAGFSPSNGGPYDVVLGPTVTLVNLETTIGTNTFAPSATSTTKDGITVTATSTGTNPVVYTIVAQPEVTGGNTMTYFVNVYKADQTFTINGVDLYKVNTTTKVNDVNNATYAYPATSFTVPYSVDEVKIAVTPGSSSAVVSGTVTGTGNCNANFALTNKGTTPNVVTITVKSQYASLNSNVTNQETTFTLNIYREAPDTTNTAKTFTSTQGTASFTPVSTDVISGPFIVTSIPETAGSTTLTVTATSPKSYVQIQKQGEAVSISNATLGSDTEAFSVQTPNTVYQYTVYIWSEDTSVAPSSQVIKITTAASVNLSGDNNIADIKFYGISQQATTQKTPDGNNVVELTTKETAGKIDITASHNSAKLKVTVGNNAPVEYTGTAQVTVPVNPDSQVQVTVQCIAENGDPGTATTYTLKREKLSEETGVTTISVGGESINNPVPNNTATGVNVVTLPAGTTSTTVTTTPVDPNATVDITSVTGLVPGNNQRTVTVTAEDGTSAPYTINIYVEPAAEATDITVVNETMTPSFVKTNPNYEVHLTYEKDKVKIIVTVSDNSLFNVYINNTLGAVNEITLQTTTRGNVFETIPVRIVGKDAQGNESTSNVSTYNIKVYREEALSDNYLLDIKVNGNEIQGYDKQTNTYYIRVPRTTTSVTFTSASDSSQLNVSQGATYTIDGTSGLTPGQINDKTITVKSQAGVSNVYHFNIIPADIDVGYTNIELLESANGTALKDVTTNAPIVTYSPSTSSVSGTVNHSTSNAYLKVTAQNGNQKVKVNGVLVTLTNLRYGTLEALSDGTNTFTVDAMSEYAYICEQAGLPGLPVPNDQKLPQYTIIVERKLANGNPNLDILEVQVGGVAHAFDLTSTNVDGTGKFISNSGDSTLYITNIGNSVTQVYIKAKAVEDASVLSGDANANKTLTTLVSAQQGYTFSFTVVSTAENGATATYNITISRGPLDFDDDNSITGITLVDSANSVYVSPNSTGNLVEQWKSEVTSYPSATNTLTQIVVPYGPQSISFNVEKLTGSPAKIWIDDNNGFNQNNTNGSFQITINSNHYGNTYTYKIWAVSENGVKGTEYSFVVMFESPSKDSSITVLTVDGTTVDGFAFADLITTGSNGTKSYTVNGVVPFSKTSVTIYAEKNDVNAVIATGALGTFPLTTGVNTFSITVTAQDGSQSTYVVKITRDYQTPYISNMTLSDGKFVEMDGVTKTTFDNANAGKDEQIVNYTVKIPYGTSMITITTQTDNATYTVTESKSVKNIITDMSSTFTTPSISEGASMTFTFIVTSTEGKTKSYTLTIKRGTQAESDSSIGKISIEEIPEFEDEYDENTFNYDKKTYDFVVDHKVDKLNIDAIATANQEGATTKIYGADNLSTGNNTVVVQTTSADGLTSTTYVIEVTRKPLEWSVDTKATEFACEEKANKKLYEVNMGKSQASAVKDWTDYIVYDKDDKTITVSCLSDTSLNNLNQVILEVTDGITTEFVTLNLTYQQDFLQQMGSQWWIWAILAADVVLLTAILISVNRDKYGKVTKKRKEI